MAEHESIHVYRNGKDQIEAIHPISDAEAILRTSKSENVETSLRTLETKVENHEYRINILEEGVDTLQDQMTFVLTDKNVEDADWNASDGDGGLPARMRKVNPEGSGFFSLNRQAGTLIGKYSIAIGNNNIAVGEASYSEGSDNISTGVNAHSEGRGFMYDEIVLTPIGDCHYQHNFEDDFTNFKTQLLNGSDGLDASIVDDIDFPNEATLTKDFITFIKVLQIDNTSLETEEELTDDSGTALPEGVAVEGYYIYFSGAFDQSAHSEGYMTLAEGVGAHSEGVLTRAIYTGHAEGHESRAAAYAAHAEGFKTEAEGQGAHAEGTETQAFGKGSHAEGLKTIANGFHSHAEGINTLAKSSASHAEGHGTSVESDWGGHAEGALTKVIGINGHAEGSLSIAFGHESHAENSSFAWGNRSHAEGCGWNAEGDTTVTISGVANTTEYTLHTWDVDSMQVGAIIEYNGIVAEILEVSYATDSQSTITVDTTLSPIQDLENQEVNFFWGYAKGLDSHIEGFATRTIERAAHAEGWQSVAGGIASHAEGAGTKATGPASHAEGTMTEASGLASHVEGFGTIAANNYQHVQGLFNEYEETENYIHIIGHGTSDDDRKNIHWVSTHGDAWYAGNLEAEDITANGLITAEALEITGPSTLTGDVTINGNLIINGESSGGEEETLTIPMPVAGQEGYSLVFEGFDSDNKPILAWKLLDSNVTINKMVWG